MPRRTSPLLSLPLVLALALTLTGCSVIAREMGNTSTGGVVEGVEAAAPESTVTLSGYTSGFSSVLTVSVEVPDAQTVTPDDALAAVTAVCDAEPVGYDSLELLIASGEPETADRVFADTGALLAEAIPDAAVASSSMGLETVCEAVAS